MGWRSSLRTEEEMSIDIDRKDLAIDAAIRCLDRLSKKGSITKALREETMAQLWEARQTPLEERNDVDTDMPQLQE